MHGTARWLLAALIAVSSIPASQHAAAASPAPAVSSEATGSATASPTPDATASVPATHTPPPPAVTRASVPAARPTAAPAAAKSGIPAGVEARVTYSDPGRFSPMAVRLAAIGTLRTPTGYAANAIAAGDDTYSSVVALPLTMNWNGTSYTNIYINMNGNCTFGSFSTAYDPVTSMATTNRDMLAPFWADVDTRGTASGTSLMTYSDITSGNVPQVNGRNAFIVNWVGVGRYNQSGPLNSFQLVLIDRSDTGAGNFDIEYDYGNIAWDRGVTSSNSFARAGWSRAGNVGYEIAGGNASGAYLDTGANALVEGSLNSGGVQGRYVWGVRNGVPPNSPPSISRDFVTRTLEANSPSGYVGYSGAADAAATDPDGSVASFTRSPAAGSVLPYGDNAITWTATDNLGLVSTTTQHIIVSDTVVPTLPTLTSPTHPTGTWSQAPSVTMNWTDSTDSGSGLAGYSYSWTAGSAGLPDTTTGSGFTAGSATASQPGNETFATAAWPPGWAKGGTNPAQLTLTNAAARAHGTYAPQVTAATNNNRVTAQFTRAFDLSQATGATLSWWDYLVGSGNGDYSQVDYSLDGGTSWAVLRNDATNGTVAWTRRTAPLPTGPTATAVLVRFSGSLNRPGEYACWDDITLDTTGRTPNSLSASPGDGTWYFNVRSGDARGNWTPAASYGPVLIDTAAPSTASNVPAAWTSTSPFTVVLSPTDGTSGVASTSYTLDGGPMTPYAAPFTVSTDGTHTIQYWSTDNAGNVESARTATLRKDSVAPVTASNAGVGWYTAGNFSLVLSPTDTGGSGLAATMYRIDGGSVSTYTAPVSVTVDGTHTIDFWSVDNAGNAEAAKTATLRKDSNAPVSSTNVPAGWTTGPIFPVSIAATDNGGSGVAWTRYSLDGGAVTTYTVPFGVSTDGTHTVLYWSQDAAGNVEAAKTATLRKDGVAPATASNAPAGWHTSGGFSLVLTPTDTGGSGVASTAYRLDGGATAAYTAAVPITADGTHTVQFWSVDGAGNSEATRTATVRKDSNAPSSTTNVPAAWVVSPSFTVTMTAADGTGSGVASTKYTLDGGAVTAYASGFAVSTDGTHAILYWSVDAAGNSEATSTTTLRKDSTPPSAAASITATPETTTSVVARWTASTDAASGVSHYSVYRDGSLVATTSARTWTDTGLASGSTHSYRVVATDAAGNAGAPSPAASTTIPNSSLWLTIDTVAVGMGTVTPGIPVTRPTATFARVGGLGTVSYTLSCSAEDMSYDASGTAFGPIPASYLSYATTGARTLAKAPFSNADTVIDAGTGVPGMWQRSYEFAYGMDAPLTAEPGPYKARVVYTLIEE